NMNRISKRSRATITNKVTKITNTTNPPRALGGGTMTSPTTANAAKQTAVSHANNMTGETTGPGAAIPGNVTNPTNATSSPSAVGGGNITSPGTATAANQTASMQSGGQ